MNPATRTLTRCLVCGFTEVRTDEVVDRGVVLLAECPRCRHQWTARPGPSGRGTHRPGAAGETAEAA